MRRTCLPPSSPGMARSPGARTPRQPGDTRSRSSWSPAWPDNARPRPGRAADARVPARTPLPAQARVDRVLRPAAAMTDTDRAAVARLHGAGDLRMDDEPVASRHGRGAPAGDLVGLCGSDLHWYREGAIGDAGLPGRWSSATSSAASSSTGLGQASGSSPIPRSRAGLRACRPGRARVPRWPVCRVRPTDGALRSLMAWPGRLLHRLPETIGDDEAALLEPLGVALHALRLGPIARGGRAGVYGCGPLGLLLIQVLRQAGASVIVATDRLPHRVAAATAMGATDGFIVDEAGVPTRPTPAGRHARPRSTSHSRWQATTTRCPTRSRRSSRAAGWCLSASRGRSDQLPGRPARRKELTIQLSRRMAAADLTDAIALAGSGSIDLPA